MRWIGLTVLLWALAAMAPVPPAGAAQGGVKTRNGEYRTWHTNGRLAELRHYVDGREVGLQQSWTADGVLFLNYEVRNGRRYGLVNSKPCLPADDGAAKGVM